MAEAIFTSEQIKEFSCPDTFTRFTLFETVFSRFIENLFVGYRPGYTGYRKSQNKQINDVFSKIHFFG